MASRAITAALLLGVCCMALVPAHAAECGTAAGDAEGLFCGCATPEPGLSVAPAIDFDPISHMLTGRIRGAHGENVDAGEVVLGPGGCFTVHPLDIKCDCVECVFETTRAEFTEQCGWVKQQLGSGSMGVSIPIRVSYNKTTYNILGDRLVHHAWSENSVEVVTADLHTGFVSTPTARLVDMLIVSDSLTPAAIGNSVAMQSVNIQLDSSMPIELLPGWSFDNPDVSMSARVTSPACNPTADLCKTEIELDLTTPAILCKFSGVAAMSMRPGCAGCADFTATVDLASAEYNDRFCVTQEAELTGVPSIAVVPLNPVATATQPAQFRVTAELHNADGVQVPSTLTGVVAYHAPDGESCSVTARSTTIVDSTGSARVPFVQVSPDADPDADHHAFTFNIYATAESVQQLLALEGASHGLERLRNSRGLRMCIGVLLTRTLPGSRRLGAGVPAMATVVAAVETKGLRAGLGSPSTTGNAHGRATAAADKKALVSGADAGGASIDIDPSVSIDGILDPSDSATDAASQGSAFVGSTGFIAIVAVGVAAVAALVAAGVAVTMRRNASSRAFKSAHVVPACVATSTKATGSSSSAFSRTSGDTTRQAAGHPATEAERTHRDSDAGAAPMCFTFVP